MTIMHKNALIIFAKMPIAGNVKTRLAAGIGDENALYFYKECAGKLFDIPNSLEESDVWLFAAEKDDMDLIKKWVGKDFLFRRQSDGDLGNKMKNAFRDVFKFGDRKAVIVGTDIPDISYSVIEEAFDALNDNDAVIGSCNDGGYYLLGLKRMIPSLFENIEWSTDKVYWETIKRMQGANMKYKTLKTLMDVDDIKSLQMWLSAEGERSKLKEKLRRKFEGIINA